MNLPTGRFAAVVIDPPWDYGIERARIGARNRRNAAAAQHYSTLSVDQLADMDVPSLLEPGGHLWLWVTNTGLAEGWHLPLFTAWRVRPVTVVTWVKQGAPTLGQYARGTTEHAILAVNGWHGKPASPAEATHIAPDGATLTAAKRAHSVKPGAFGDLVEQLKPDGPWCELFARQQRLGWTSWGLGWEQAS